MKWQRDWTSKHTIKFLLFYIFKCWCTAGFQGKGFLGQKRLKRLYFISTASRGLISRSSINIHFIILTETFGKERRKGGSSEFFPAQHTLHHTHHTKCHSEVFFPGRKFTYYSLERFPPACRRHSVSVGEGKACSLQKTLINFVQFLSAQIHVSIRKKASFHSSMPEK